MRAGSALRDTESVVEHAACVHLEVWVDHPWCCQSATAESSPASSSVPPGYLDRPRMRCLKRSLESLTLGHFCRAASLYPGLRLVYGIYAALSDCEHIGDPTGSGWLAASKAHRYGSFLVRLLCHLESPPLALFWLTVQRWQRHGSVKLYGILEA